MLLLLFLSVVSAQFCRDPQKVGFISLQALSHRDQLTYVFHNITRQMPMYNQTNIIDQISYSIINMTVQLWYNDVGQLEQFLDDHRVKVSSGRLHMSFSFNYSYGGNRGTAIGQYSIDQFSFIKSLQIVDGILEWYPSEQHNLTFSSLFRIERSTPQLPDAEKKNFQNMLNDHLSYKVDLRDRIFYDINQQYQNDLKPYLNDEHLVNTTNFNYTWKGKNITYLNLINDYQLTNINFTGLTYRMQFELSGYQTRCNVLPRQFIPEYGGVQEHMAFDIVQATVMYALKQGWLDVKLGQSWNSQIFQFYMGDVANFISNAKKELPNIQVEGSCKWNNTQYDVTVSKFSQNELFVSIPYFCELTAPFGRIQSFHFTFSIKVQLIARQNQLEAIPIYVGMIKTVFIPEGQYVVTNQKVGELYLESVLKNIIGMKGFGTGFPLLPRKYPVLYVGRDYITIYDASQK